MKSTVMMCAATATDIPSAHTPRSSMPMCVSNPCRPWPAVSTHFWLIALLLILSAAKPSVAAGESATYDSATGYIQSQPGLPVFEPGLWAAPYLITLRNLTFDRNRTESREGAMYGRYVLDVNHTWDMWIKTTKCSTDTSTFETYKTLSESCWYRNTSGTTFDYWYVAESLAYEQANCYCYALNRFEGGDCSPGTRRNGGHAKKAYMDSDITCPLLHQALVVDGAVPVSRETALKGQPDRGHYIAALARPKDTMVHGGNFSRRSKIAEEQLDDFHFLRKDADGTWSNKFPFAAPFNTDMEGKPITDPEAALLGGHYFVCGYFQVQPKKMPLGVIAPQTGPMVGWLPEKAKKAPGVTVEPFVRLPFNATVFANWVFQEDLDWERKRGTPEYEEWKQKQLVKLGLMPAAAGSGDSSSTGNSKGRRDQSSRKLLM